MEISKEERELYDRQIRLWGLDGQNRLLNARILVIGFEAVAVEVVKNLCLAGVGAITLQSSKLIDEDDLGYNFFITFENIGQNAAEASALAVQRLNPRVNIASETRPLSQIDENLYKSHDVVIVTQLEDREELVRINNISRSVNAAFYYSILRGWASLLFVDLGPKPHQFVVEKEVVDKTSTIGKVSPTQEVLSVKPPAEGTTKEKLTITETYVDFKSVLNASVNFGNSLKVRQRSRVSPYLVAFLALLESPTDPKIIEYARKLGLESLVISEDFIDEFKSSGNIQLSSIAAVVGGLLSQEVLNYLTQLEYPIQNTFIYDAKDGKGPVYHLCS